MYSDAAVAPAALTLHGRTMRQSTTETNIDSTVATAKIETRRRATAEG